MDLTHRFCVPASVDETWTAFNHLDRLAPCFPGATITSVNGDHFEGSIKIKMGSMALVYQGSGRFLERDAEARRLVFQASGDDRRGNGTAAATVTASLAGNGSGTDVELVTDLDFTGRPAQFGSGVVSDVTDKLLDQFVSCVSVRFAEGLGIPEDEVAEPAVDDELWEEWAEAEESADGQAPGDIEQTVEMAAVAAEEDSAASTDEAWLAEDEDEAGPVGGVRGATAVPPPFRHTPASDLSSTNGHAVANVVGTLLRRYGPLLGLLALLVVVVVRVVQRRRL